MFDILPSLSFRGAKATKNLDSDNSLPPQSTGVDRFPGKESQAIFDRFRSFLPPSDEGGGRLVPLGGRDSEDLLPLSQLTLTAPLTRGAKLF